MKFHLAVLITFIGLSTLSGQSTTDFPRVPGWKLADSLQVYTQETLWEYINGAADYYLKFGFDSLVKAEYLKGDNEYIQAEVYYHHTDLDAFGIYSYEKQPEATVISVGIEGYTVHSVLNFYTANCYVKVHSHLQDEKTRETLLKISRKLAVELEAHPERPELLSLFPDFEKVIGSERYTPGDYLGYSFFTQVLSCDYTFGESGYTLFLVKHDSPEKATETIRKFLEYASIDNMGVTEGIISYNDPFNGLVTLIPEENYVLGIYGLDDEEFSQEFLLQFADYVQGF